MSLVKLLLGRKRQSVVWDYFEYEEHHEKSRCTVLKGPSIKYVTLFLANFDPPPPCHTLSHIPRPPQKYVTHLGPPRFSVGLVQKPEEKPPVQILSQLFAGAFVRGHLSRGLLSGMFCPGWVLSITPSVRIHLLQQKVKNHFKFHVS